MLERFVEKVVKNVSLARDIAQFADRIADLVERQEVDRAGFGYDVFLEHQRTHVVGTKEEGQLTDLESLGDPTALNVRDVIEEQSRDGLGFQVLERAGRRDVAHLGIFGLKCPADEGGKALGLVLKASESLEVLDTFCEGFGVSEHHRCRADATHFMPDSHDIEPIVGHHFAAGDCRADSVDEDFGSSPWNASESSLLEPCEYRFDREFVDFGKVVQFRGAKAVDIDVGESGFDIPEELLVPLEFEVGVQSTLHEDLVAAEIDGFLDLLEQFLSIQHVAFVAFRGSVKRAEVANRGADVGVVDIPIDIVGSVVLGVQAVGNRLCCLAKGAQVGALE